MHIPSASLRTIQMLPEQLSPETQVYSVVEAGIAAARRFEREHGEHLLDRLRADQRHAHTCPVRSALAQLRERDVVGPEDPIPTIRDGLRCCPETEEAELHEAAEAMMTAVAAARDALAAWRALNDAGGR